MNTIEIANILKRNKLSRRIFCGVIPIDHLPQHRINRACAYIVNTQPSNLSGEHWIALYISRYRIIEYFDPYGIQPINPEIFNFIQINGNKYIYNKFKIQTNKSTNCGLFCIFYIYLKLRNIN